MLLVLVSACLVSFETPDAYQVQRFLCDDRSLVDAEVLRCAGDPVCAGVMSFQGEIEGIPVTVDSTVKDVDVTLVDLGTDRQLDSVGLVATAPYFRYAVTVDDIGAPWGVKSTDWEVDFGEASVEWEITAGPDQAVLDSRPGEGTVSVTKSTEQRIDLTFDGGIGESDDGLAACLVVFPQRIVVTSK